MFNDVNRTFNDNFHFVIYATTLQAKVYIISLKIVLNILNSIVR